MYIDDGLWDQGGTRFVGWEALEEFYANVPPGMTRNGVRHFSTNIVPVPTEEGARGSAYMMALGHLVRLRCDGDPVAVRAARLTSVRKVRSCALRYASLW